MSSTQEKLLDSKTCSRCSKVLSIDSFSYDSTNKRYKAGCKKCLSSWYSKYAVDNKQRVLETSPKIIVDGKLTRGQYRSLHQWVASQLGRPSECEMCGCTEKKRYEWANISGKYKRDTADWVRLCAKCHRAYDKAGEKQSLKVGEKCRSGKHTISEGGVYTYPNGAQECRACKQDWYQKHKHRWWKGNVYDRNRSNNHG